MCPLLAAYDQHLASAHRDARARERQLKRAQDRVRDCRYTMSMRWTMTTIITLD